MRGAHLVWRFTRGMTLGVRGAAIDPDNRVCLVRHTYMDGCTCRRRRRAGRDRPRRHETGVPRGDRDRPRPGRHAVLHGFYFNTRASRRDHVALYVARAFTVPVPKRPDREIAETAFFPLDALPPETTPPRPGRGLPKSATAPRPRTW